MIGQQENAILQNIKSLIQQIEQIEAGEEMAKQADDQILVPEEKEEKVAMADDDTQKPMAEGEVDEEDMNKEDMALAKSILRAIRKADEGTTASDDADARLGDDIPEVDQDNIDEVAKMLTKLAKKSKSAPVKKASKNNELEDVKMAILDLTKVVKSIADDNNEVQKAVASILDGIGVADAITSVQKSEVPVQRRSVNKPVADRPSVRKAIMDEIRNNSGNRELAQSNTVRKNLGSVMKSLFSQ